jgi:hypothetical protein
MNKNLTHDSSGHVINDDVATSLIFLKKFKKFFFKKKTEREKL